MSLGTGFFAIIATDTEGFVDQKYIGCFANTLAYKKLDNAARFRCGFHPDVFDDAFLKLVIEFLAQIRSLIEIVQSRPRYRGPVMAQNTPIVLRLVYGQLAKSESHHRSKHHSAEGVNYAPLGLYMEELFCGISIV